MENIGKPERTLVVGNIFGGLKALRQCLISSEYNQEKDQLIFMGNYVGKFPDSAATIETLVWLRETSVHKPIFLTGIGDKWCGRWLSTGKLPSFWLSYDGKEVVKDYMQSKYIKSDFHRDFFNNLKSYYVDKQNRGFVHGGFTKPQGLGYEVASVKYYFNKDIWRESLINQKKHFISKRGIPTKFKSFLYEEMYVAGDPTTDNIYTYSSPETKIYMGKIGTSIDKPMKRRNIWNVNTGSGQGYSLTIMDIDSKMVWQSAPLREIYPKKQEV